MGPRIEPGTFGLANECSTTELILLLIYQIFQYVKVGSLFQTMYPPPTHSPGNGTGTRGMGLQMVSVILLVILSVGLEAFRLSPRKSKDRESGSAPAY